MVKIVSTSAYGNDERYIIGAKRQYELTKELFSDWEFRLYTDNASKYKELTNANIIEITDGSHGVFWRFLPLFENKKNIVIVRDSDSRLNIREHKAISEWLNSNYQFHNMKDHEAHLQFPIMAGMFGLKGQLDKNILDVMNHFMFNTNFYTNDQYFLKEYVFPIVKNTTLLHTYLEGWFGESRDRLINKYDFCGNGYTEDDYPLYAPNLKEQSVYNIQDMGESNKFNMGKMYD